MHLLRRPDYISETGEFLEDLKRKDASLEERQIAGHDIYWEPEMAARAMQQGFTKAKVPMQGYVYATHPKTAL
ncbi:MAG: DUF3460 family protein [Brachymonas sp.]|nr:DUF3460 family protein [Brachymonas sp.]